jgi:hypothetical protein
MPHHLALNRNGEWTWDGVEVTHTGTRRFLFEHLVLDSVDGLVVRCGADQTEVEVEDVPFIIRSVHIPTAEQTATEIRVVLQDGTAEPLNLRSLRIGPANALYTRVQGGRRGGPFDARFSRSAYHMLADCIEETADGRFILRFRGNAWLIE